MTNRYRSNTPKGESKEQSISFETNRVISNPHLSEKKIARAIYQAVADSSLDLSGLRDEKQLYQLLLEHIDQGEFIIRE